MVADFKEKVNVFMQKDGAYRCQWFKIDMADNTVISYAEDVVDFIEKALDFIREYFSGDEDVIFKAAYNLDRYKAFRTSEEY